MSAKPSASVEVDPVMAAFERAPMGSPLGDEEQRLVDAAQAEARSPGARFVTHAEVMGRIAQRARDEG